MAILGGSPLGLIGVMSTPTRDGMSTFNGGKSRNVNINLYNVGKEGDKEKMSKTNNANGGLFSVFTGGNVIRPWGNIKTTGKEKADLGLNNNFKGVVRRDLHNNDVYDTSILNIVEKLAGTAAALRPSDFAYLKKLGVYSNNRLVIARRFAGPVHDDIYAKNQLPIAVMICWRKEDEDFLEISFGEEWENAKADFTALLNNLASDFTIGPAGTAGGAAFGAVPLPGFTEHFTRGVLKKLGILSENGDILPAGNPNLIKEAKRRKTIPQGDAGAGLRCTVSIKMLVEYEQKFISGIDPTIVFQDIIANIVRFGTSPGEFYQLSPTAAANIMAWVENPSLLITRFVSSLKAGIQEAKTAITEAITQEYETKIQEAGAPGEDPENPVDEKVKLENEKNKLIEQTGQVIDKMLAEAGKALDKTVQKYKVEIEGIIKSLSGLPSTPWHVTIGNPLRPIFCSGDLYMQQDLSLKLGPTLAFNDLPSNISAEFTLSNARAWGAGEIMSKFNTGYLRSVNMQKDTFSVAANESVSPFNLSEAPSAGLSQSGSTPSNPDATVSNNANNTGSSASVAGSGTSPTTTKENQEQPTVNSDPNSNSPVVQGETTPNPTPTGPSASNREASSFDFTVVGESLLIAPGVPTTYAITGTYSIAGKEYKGRGAGRSEDIARTQARRDAKEQAKG